MFGTEELAAAVANSNVETYLMRTASGRPIRQATLVRFDNGRVVQFTERMSKREAVRQALELLSRE
jgi:hypothetical protein